MFTHHTRASAYTRLESGVKLKLTIFLVVIDFKLSLITRLYCTLRGWRRKGRGGEGGEKKEGILAFSFSDNFYLALQCFF